MSDILRYGILSDTHGSVHADVFKVFHGVQRIYHCGDIGSPACAAELETIAPLRCVYGNMDPWPISSQWPEQVIEAAEFGVVALYHGTRYGHSNEAIMTGLYKRFSEEEPRVILFGHSHTALIEQRHGILFINPGSASMPSHGEPPTVAVLRYNKKTDVLKAELISLPIMERNPRGIGRG